MAPGTDVDMFPDTNTRASLFDDRLRAQNGNLEHGLLNELGLQYQNYDRNERERDLNMNRSGSAPPTIEGSYNAINSLFQNLDFPNGGFSEEEMRSHPAYLSYYYSHDNINPRLPPPLLSKEEWRMHQRLRSGGLPYGEIPAWRRRCVAEDGDDASLFSVQPAMSVHKENSGTVDPTLMNFTNTCRQASSLYFDSRDHELARHGGAGLGGMGVRRRSFADIVQEGSNRPTALSGPIPVQASRNVSYDILDSCNSSSQPAEFWNALKAKEGFHSGAAPNLGRVHTHHSSASRSFPSPVGSSFSRSSTPEFQRVSRSPTPNLPSEERFFPGNLNNRTGSYVPNSKSSSMNNLSDFAACLSLNGLDHSGNGLSDNGRLVNTQMQQGHANQMNFQPNMNIDQHQQLFGGSTGQKLVASPDYPSSRTPTNLDSKLNLTRIRGLNEQNSYNNTGIPVVPNHAPVGYSINQNINTRAENYHGSGGQFNGRCRNSMQLDQHYQPTDSADIQYYRHPANQKLLVGGKFVSASHDELSKSQKAYLDATISGQKQRYGLPLLQKGPGINDGYYEGLTYLLGMPYQGAVMANSLRDIRFGNSVLQRDISTSMKGTLLEEFKNKTKPFELSDIIGHVVEFSMDQCGSRFIQQKLEIATNEEKMKIFPEITPHARALMTDVFGNYVIQKFFERGTESQRNVLAGKIKNHVLQLSLQMYGCRVIQKALETLEVDEKTQLVVELDGSVLKCVRDQNGNHVIQKCIECVPEDKIQFIISSFFGQVVPLSTHPYGCRVIQRVLEHSKSEDTQKRIMVEIMQSICTLAQDQYGNYVIQHVIQHGKPEERSVIISKLKGQIVQMSQQKFASNVIEKCLTFGSPEERELLVNEMLGSTDVNEPLQDMMKDAFGNYVVQKVLETCDEQTRELILSRIKLHLCDLKKYTYVKHVVARVEKLLVTAGERSPGPE